MRIKVSGAHSNGGEFRVIVVVPGSVQTVQELISFLRRKFKTPERDSASLLLGGFELQAEDEVRKAVFQDEELEFRVKSGSSFEGTETSQQRKEPIPLEVEEIKKVNVERSPEKTAPEPQNLQKVPLKKGDLLTKRLASQLEPKEKQKPKPIIKRKISSSSSESSSSESEAEVVSSPEESSSSSSDTSSATQTKKKPQPQPKTEKTQPSLKNEKTQIHSGPEKILPKFSNEKNQTQLRDSQHKPQSQQPPNKREIQNSFKEKPRPIYQKPPSFFQVFESPAKTINLENCIDQEEEQPISKAPGLEISFSEFVDVDPSLLHEFLDSQKIDSFFEIGQRIVFRYFQLFLDSNGASQKLSPYIEAKIEKIFPGFRYSLVFKKQNEPEEQKESLHLTKMESLKIRKADAEKENIKNVLAEVQTKKMEISSRKSGQHSANLLEEKEKHLVEQVNFYFSDKNYFKDAFLMEHIKNDPEGMALEILLRFPRIAALQVSKEQVTGWLASHSKEKECNYFLARENSKIRKKMDSSVF